MTATRRFFSARSLTQALLAAARHHGVEPEMIAYTEVEKKHGFLRSPRGVVIDVDPDSPVKTPEEAAPVAEVDPPQVVEPTPEPAPESTENVAEAEPVEAETPVTTETKVEEIEFIEPVAPEIVAPSAEAPPAQVAEAPEESASLQGDPLSVAADSDSFWEDDEPAPAIATPDPADGPESNLFEVAVPEAPAAGPETSRAPSTVELDDDLRLKVAAAIDSLAHLAGLRVQVASTQREEEGLRVELEGPDGRRLLAKRGRAILAMEYLLPRLLWSEVGEYLHCRVDCEGFHAERTSRVTRAAKKAAERVRDAGKPWLLEPMAPDERRMVHMALSEEPGIETSSVGDGFLKRVRVTSE